MILPLSINTLYVGLSLSERYGFSHFDSLIVASALEAGCSKLYSEDMRNGLLVNQRVKDSDPFLL